MKRSPFTVIDGTPPPETPVERTRRRLRETKPAVLVRCPRCSGNAVLQIRIGLFWSAGKPVGGQKQMICAMCHSKGEHVVISF